MGRKRISIGTEGEAFTGRVVTSGDNDEQYKVTVPDSTTETIQSFTQEMIYFLLYNRGPYGVHVDTDELATTDSFYCPSKSWISLGAPFTTLHFICESGQNTVLYVWGIQ